MLSIWFRAAWGQYSRVSGGLIRCLPCDRDLSWRFGWPRLIWLLLVWRSRSVGLGFDRRSCRRLNVLMIRLGDPSLNAGVLELFTTNGQRGRGWGK
jgi:hypothetical protein